MQPRLEAENGAFAFLSLAEMVAGQILDIHEHGLSFRYVASEQKVKGKCLVDIMMRDGGSHCYLLPCSVAWDRAEPKEFSLGPFTMRVCGIHFDKLTASQKTKVKQFVRENTELNPDNW
jgi:hypothetical protein